MADRKILLARLHEMFGDCSRKTFLQRLYNFDGDIKPLEPLEPPKPPEPLEPLEPPKPPEPLEPLEPLEPPKPSELPKPSESQVKMIDINGTDAWLKHVRALKNISGLNACLDRYKTLLGKSMMLVYSNSVRKNLTAMLKYVDKYFKEPQDITEETSEDLARQTGKFVKENISNLLKPCHRGKTAGRGEELKFYEDFEVALESYLETICVYRKDIPIGADIRTNANWFETPYIKESIAPEKIGTIAEIELAPRIIYFRNDNGVREDIIIRGVCIAFAEARQR